MFPHYYQLFSPARLFSASVLTMRSLVQRAMAAPPRTQDWVLLGLVAAPAALLYLLTYLAQQVD